MLHNKTLKGIQYRHIKEFLYHYQNYQIKFQISKEFSNDRPDQDQTIHLTDQTDPKWEKLQTLPDTS